jgi:hypothetical protein
MKYILWEECHCNIGKLMALKTYDVKDRKHTFKGCKC